MQQKFDEYLPEDSKGGCKQRLGLNIHPQGRKQYRKNSRPNWKKDDEEIRNSKGKQNWDDRRICMSI